MLPDGYPVKDPSLDDISAVLNPKFTPAQVAELSNSLAHPPKPSFDLTNKPYIPGYVGLNNIKANDYLNVIIHALLHVPPISRCSRFNNQPRKSTGSSWTVILNFPPDTRLTSCRNS